LELEYLIITASLLAGAYLIGSIPSGLVMARVISGRDVREHGSGNIGMVNVFRAAGPVAGVATFVLDGLKGLTPILLGMYLGLSDWALILVAAAAILGHNWSIILRGKGGKGIATSVGTIGAFAPPVALLAIGIWVAIVLTSRYASLASLLMLATLPALLTVFDLSWPYILYAAVLFVIAAFQHRENINRLREGSELKVRFGSTAVRHGD
jgi:acyl phosphate:glycerol-3-phosphate acyltransferase